MNTPLRVVMVSAGFWPTVGGAERQALELSVALVRGGAQVTVLTRRFGLLPSRQEVQGVVVRRLWTGGDGALNSLTFLLGVLGWLFWHGDSYDAIHAHLAGSPALAAGCAGRFLNKPVVVKLGGGRGIGELAASSRTGLGRLKLRTLSFLKPHFLAVVPDLAADARDYLPGARIEVLPNGVDVDRFQPAAAGEKIALRVKLGWPSGPIFLYTGRFSPEKRLPWFSRIWVEALGGRRATLILVGDGSERKALEAEAAASGGRVRIIPSTDNLTELYAAADAFVLPSTSEGLSNSLLEAMASALCVIASAVGGTAETIENGVTGLLFARDDAAAAAACVRRVLDDPAASALGANARRVCEQRYALSRVAERCAILYRREPA